MTMEELTRYYGLCVNPFRAGELVPATDEDLNLYASVDGFAKEEATIKKDAPNLSPQIGRASCRERV